MLLFKFEPDRIVPGVGHVGEPIDHSQGEEDRGVSAQRDAGVALLYLVQGRPADGGPLRQNRDGYAPPPPRIANVVPELSQSACHRYRNRRG